MKLIIIVVVVILGLSGVFFVNQNNSNTNSAPSLTIQVINNGVANGGQLIDVRTPTEYTNGHIDGAINLPLQDIQSGATPTVARTKTIYLYCHSGNRSGQAASALKTAGYQHIIDLGAMAHVQSIGGTIKT